MAAPNDAGDDGDENNLDQLPDEGVEMLDGGIRALLERRDMFLSTAAPIRARQLSGEDVQGAIEGLLDDIDSEGEVLNTLHVIDNGGVEDVLEVCRSRGDLSEDEADEARGLFAEIEWMIPGAAGAWQTYRGEYYWTEIVDGLAGTNEEDRLLFGQRAMHGVDELWHIQAPMDAMFDQALGQIAMVVNVINQLPPAQDLAEEDRQAIEAAAEVLEYINEEFQEVAEDIVQPDIDPDGIGLDDIDFDDDIDDLI